MLTSCAMMALRDIPPAKEGAEVDEAEEAGGVAILVRGHFSRSWASLHLTVATFMAHMTEKYGDSG